MTKRDAGDLQLPGVHTGFKPQKQTQHQILFQNMATMRVILPVVSYDVYISARVFRSSGTSDQSTASGTTLENGLSYILVVLVENKQ